MANQSNGANLGFEQKLWSTADKQQKATDTVLEQAKLLCKDWAEINGHSSIQKYVYESSPAYAVAEKDKDYKK